MKQKIFLLFIVFTVWFTSCTDSNKIQYPDTKKVDQVDEYFGIKVEDPYRWLEDDRSSETEAWVKSENQVTADYLAQIPFREKIKNRLTELFAFETITSPVKKGDSYYYFKEDGVQDQPVLYMRKSADNEPVVLIDPNKLSEDGTVAMDKDFAISNDGKYIAYQISKAGSDWHEILVKEIKTGKDLEDRVKWVKFSDIAWYKNGFYYSGYSAAGEGEELTELNRFQKV
ncbi:MAG: S9 family peptidase, partial [Marinilabiliales bacterium]